MKAAKGRKEESAYLEIYSALENFDKDETLETPEWKKMIAHLKAASKIIDKWETRLSVLDEFNTKMHRLSVGFWNQIIASMEFGSKQDIVDASEWLQRFCIYLMEPTQKVLAELLISLSVRPNPVIPEGGILIPFRPVVAISLGAIVGGVSLILGPPSYYAFGIGIASTIALFQVLLKKPKSDRDE